MRTAVAEVGMYSFESEGEWSDRIARISTQPRFQKSVIRIEDQSTVDYGEYDTELGGYPEPTGVTVVYEGQARVIPIRWGTFTGGESQANATTLSAIRVQIPKTPETTVRIKRGCKIFVTDSPNNPAINGLIFTITSDMQGSSAAARTFEAALDADVTVVPSGVNFDA